MKIPSSFKLGGVTWKVERAPLNAALGLCYNGKALIQLEKDLPKAVEGQTFCHELVHAIQFAMGRHTEPHDEQFTDAFAVFLHQYLEQHGK